MNTLKTGFLILALALAGGCAYTPQTVEIDPEIVVAETDIGHGVQVGVYVVDERTNKELGRRGTGMMQGAAITTDQDVAEVFATEIVEGLQKKGFDAASVTSPAAGTATLLRVDIRSIEYETSVGFWTGGVHVRGSMKGTATKDGASYDKFYQVDDEKRVVVVPGADSNAQMINATVSAVIQEMFNDVDLFDFLAD